LVSHETKSDGDDYDITSGHALFLLTSAKLFAGRPLFAFMLRSVTTTIRVQNNRKKYRATVLTLDQQQQQQRLAHVEVG
jgi:hypothetical protein